MEIEEEEVKLEATEPEKDGAFPTLGLRRRRAPEQTFRGFDQPSSIEFLSTLAENQVHGIPHSRGIAQMDVPLPDVASRNTQQPPPDLQANDNRVENLAPSVPSQDDSMNDNDVNQLVVYAAEAEQLQDAGESSRPREISGWTLLVTNLIVEIASAVFYQMGYALIGMVLAFVALLLATVELIHMARKERSTSTSATRKPVGTIVEYFGLAGAVWQCVYSTVEYIYTRQGKDNPIKMYLLPFIFLLCVVISKLLVDKRSIDESS
ncbi:uncharacterized protein [Populus alba]|uniref:Transmembrane protein n=1 Tax=Populus alba x Populus x berolinensis TaxID=444605 RepID=A0AAD6RI48_9ROSI|nr:uncharacterized protein LOC118027912 isoform X2 [Populus alba]KAJ7009464.1 hypothetical protein NC653_000218 [Populus alba x Populus x berolinensis]